MADRPSVSVPLLLVHVQPDELCAEGWQHALSQMAASLARQAGLTDATPLLDSAMQREETEPTYLGKGMALPHARVAGLGCAGVCVAHSTSGIPWHAECAHLVIFLAVPEEQPELYLHLMSRLVRWHLRQGENLCPTPAWEEELRAALA